MSANTSIQWTDRTWGPVRGCSRVSEECANCYAMGMAHRFSGPGKPYDGLTTIRRGKVDWTGVARLIPKALAEPLTWKKPQRVFVNSMSDLFHESLSNEEVAAVFGVMAACPQHTFQVLTKRSARMRKWFNWIEEFGGLGPYIRSYAEALRGFFDSVIKTEVYRGKTARSSADPWCSVFNAAGVPVWPLPNLWLGVSTGTQKAADERIPDLLSTPATVRFISAEPLLEPLDLSEWIRRVDHCDDCGTQNEPVESDRCPRCQSERGLISTWGKAQAERYESRERYEHNGPSENEDGPQLHWVVCGGESGPGARPFELAWARSLRDECSSAGVDFFLKQLGSHPIIDPRYRRELPGFRRLHDRSGGDMDEWPQDLRVRQFPEIHP